MRILLTNDDGFHAPGLIAMYRAIADMGDVVVVAPSTVQSATGHAVTFDRPIQTQRRRVLTDHGEEILGTAVEGRPADCVKLALNRLVDEPVDLVISGMNAGCNIGINVFYSGTVGAALEGAIQGVPSIAVSLHIGDRTKTPWDRAAIVARGVIDEMMSGPLDPSVMMNLNIPILDDDAEPAGLKVLPVSTSALIDDYHQSHDLSGDHGYTAVDSVAFRHTPPGSDVEAIFDRFITLTPLCIDLTHHEQVNEWSKHFNGK